MNTQNLNLVDKVIELAKKFGSVNTEVVISNISDTTVEARRGDIEFSNVSDNSSISLRVIDNKIGSYKSDLNLFFIGDQSTKKESRAP